VKEVMGAKNKLLILLVSRRRKRSDRAVYSLHRSICTKITSHWHGVLLA